MRLRTLPVSVAGVIAGTGCAIMLGSFKAVPALTCLSFAILAQIASNFGNEYYDFKNGIDRKGRAGFRRGVTEGEIAPQSMKTATFAVLALAAAVGCTMLLYGPWWLILVGVMIMIFALAYSTGPYPLSHHGLGDLAVVIFFGIIPVTLTCFLQTGVWEGMAVMIPVWTRLPLWAWTVPSIYMVLHLKTWMTLRDTAGAGLNPLLGRTAVNLLTFSVLFLSASLCHTAG